MKKKTTATASIPIERVKAEHGTSLLTAFQEIRELIVHGRCISGNMDSGGRSRRAAEYEPDPVRGAIHWLQREGYILEHRNVSKSRMIVAPLTKKERRTSYTSSSGRLKVSRAVELRNCHLPSEPNSVFS